MAGLGEAILQVIQRVQRPGRFWGAGAVHLPLLDLRVEGVGRLGLPIAPEQAQALVAAGVPAPYGKGPHTVVDEAVRRCRQLTPAAVHLDPRRWPPLLDAVVAEARQALGVDAPVTAELYKLLVYQPGDFFLPHRDSEKAPGMFATLVVSLPCEHTGGALHIEHGGEAAEVSLTDADLSQLHWVAFYTDCLHALKPIEGGHRVVLVYNLIRQKKKAPRPPEYTAEQAELAALLRAWPTEPAAPPLLGFPLAHRYSSAELAWATLKNEDAARAEALRAAAEAGDCALRLGMVEIEEQGAAMIAGVGDETPGPDGFYPYGVARRQSAKHTDVAMFLLALHAERPGPWLRPTAAWLVGVISEDTEARPLTSGQAPFLRTTTEAVRPYLPPGPDWLVELIGVLATLGAFDLIAEALQRALARPAVYGMDEVLLPAVRTHLVQAEPALRAALEPARAACEAHLRARIALPLEPPATHARSIEGLDCRCSFCDELRVFVASPTTREAVLAINQDARKHLESAIKQAKAEVRTRVVEQGRPYKLVCTKNQRRYDERVAQRAHDLDNLSRLLTAGHPRT